MQITRSQFESNGITLPFIKITPATTIGKAIIIHGFGGCKEELLGLGFRLAEFGLNSCTIDLRGHGQNVQPLSIDVLEDVNTFIRSVKGTERTIAIGHSLGGRLSLLSDADIRIGVSPALSQTFSDSTIMMVNNMRKHRVVEQEHNSNFKILSLLPVIDNSMGSDDLIIYGERDIPEIVKSCQALAQKQKNVISIPGAMHGDTFLLETSFEHIKNWLLRYSCPSKNECVKVI